MTDRDGDDGLNARGKSRAPSAQIHTHTVARPGGRVSVAKYFVPYQYREGSQRFA